MRKSEIERTTGETSVRVSLNIDGCGESEISTGVGFLDHMLTLFARHGRFDLNVYCEGDTYVDDHHSVEDVGIVMGTAFRGRRHFGQKLPVIRRKRSDRKGRDL